MDTNEHEADPLLQKELVFRVVGCAFEILREVGYGLHEKPYENALVVELARQAIAFAQQRRFSVLYKGVEIGEYIPDLIVADAVVVDAKVIERITDHERGQMLNYLRITKLRVGLILNFRKPKLEWERIVL